MKSLVKILVSVLALGVMASGSMLRAQAEKAAPPAGGAQGGQRGQRGGGGRGGLTIEAIETAVGKLTDDQKTKITALLDKAQKDRQALMSGGGDQQANRTKMTELNAALRKDIRAQLTDEQKAKFPETAPAGQGGGRRGQGGAGGGGGARRGGGGGGGN